MEEQNKTNKFTYEVEKEIDGEEILGELIIYIAGKCDDDSSFGATKLNKILWWSDFVAFAEHGKAWEIAGNNKEPIPYEAVFLSNEPVNGYDISRTRELAREHGWC